MASCVWEGHSWGVLGEAQLQLGAAGSAVEFGSGFSSSHTACREKAFPAHSDGCLAQSVYHGGGNNYPQATVWPSPLPEGQSPLCHLSVTSLMALEGLLCSRRLGVLFRDTSASQTPFLKAGRDPAPGLGALEVSGRGIAAVGMKGDKWDLFPVTLARPGCRDLGTGV